MLLSVAVGFAPERAGDLKELTLAHRQVLRVLAGIDVVEADGVQQRSRARPPGSAQLQEGLVDVAEEEVVEHRERRHDAQLLVHERDALGLRLARGRQLDLAAPQQDPTAVG
jgi:hypothetical protein